MPGELLVTRPAPVPAPATDRVNIGGGGGGGGADARIDFETARAAGTSICLVRFGFGYETFPAALLRGDEGLADDPRQLPAIIEQLLDSH